SSFQPGANMFEQSLLLFCDAAVIRIIEKKDIRNTNAELMRRHANLE
ncbi:MAG: 6-phospho-3-hexuloisomerase, partial [Clostridiales bacterium]|nr:6-phospho-3-hexuloisomerase [Clostridiales bacterium]